MRGAVHEQIADDHVPWCAGDGVRELQACGYHDDEEGFEDGILADETKVPEPAGPELVCAGEGAAPDTAADADDDEEEVVMRVVTRSVIRLK